jgi:hypothetical protein
MWLVEGCRYILYLGMEVVGSGGKGASESVAQLTKASLETSVFSSFKADSNLVRFN